jgi:hypothetical protein
VAAVTVDVAVLERAQEAVDTVLGNWENFVAGHPEVTSISPSFLGGWSFLIAAGAYFLGSIPTTPTIAEQARLVMDIQADLNYLKQGTVATAPLGQTLRHLNALLARWGQLYPSTDAPDTSTIVPSPSTISSAQGARLAQATARIAVWQQAHHGKVHVPLTVAEGQESAALHVMAQAAVDLGQATAAGFKAVVGHFLPELRRQVTTLVRTETQLRKLADVELRDDLRTRTQVLAQRIGDVVRWLKTEALPDLGDQIKAERDARREQDHKLTVGLATTTDTLTGEVEQLATQLAPLTAWMGGFGLHTTEKVHRNEEAIDRLGQMDFGQLLALTSFPGLAALTVDILARTVPHIPDVVAGLERAAFDALGAVT